MTKNEAALTRHNTSGPSENLNGGGKAAIACDCTEIFASSASLKTLIVEALSDIQSESRMLAAAIAIELNRDYPWLRRA